MPLATNYSYIFLILKDLYIVISFHLLVHNQNVLTHEEITNMIEKQEQQAIKLTPCAPEGKDIIYRI